MMITGFKRDANFGEAAKSMSKFGDMKISEANNLLRHLKVSAKPISIKDDFVLREDLEYHNFTVAY